MRSSMSSTSFRLGLGQPGNAHEQAVPAREDGRKDLLDDIGLSDDHAPELVHHLLPAGAELIENLGELITGLS